MTPAGEGTTSKAKMPATAGDRDRETERGGPCQPIETEVNRDSGSTYDRVSFLKRYDMNGRSQM
jgi:hypothetical protein